MYIYASSQAATFHSHLTSLNLVTKELFLKKRMQNAKKTMKITQKTMHNSRKQSTIHRKQSKMLRKQRTIHRKMHNSRK